MSEATINMLVTENARLKAALQVAVEALEEIKLISPFSLDNTWTDVSHKALAKINGGK